MTTPTCGLLGRLIHGYRHQVEVLSSTDTPQHNLKEVS